MWSVAVFAFEGPTPILTSVMPAPFGAFQMIGRHLRQAGQGGDNAIRLGDDRIAGGDKGGVAAGGVAQHLTCKPLEFIDIELVVCEQDMVLEMLWRGGGVMRQPRQRVIDALRGKRRQRQ